ncbi:GAF and ANTAR domain-containing protein [Actinosynnema sp. NPDC053489]|uniref:GAF and ANTAR domain-containing protein n=1 Tax=Actinosynnema sp. NPDC053489 TaxID=3363916 RepID=UPI0037C8EE98
MDLARKLADAALSMSDEESLEGTAARIAALAGDLVPGVDAASVSMSRRGAVRTLAGTGDLARACDAAQHDTGEGPWLDAIAHDSPVVVHDLRVESRWPRFAAAAPGARSVLSCHLSGEPGVHSALTLYAAAPSAFDDDAVTIASLYAKHAAIALRTASRLEDLNSAVHSREVIGQAVGILMQRHRVTADEAFGLLSKASQRLNVKVRRLAGIMVETGIDPRDTAELAGRAAKEAGARADQLHRRLVFGRSDDQRVSDPVAEASRRARYATARAADRLQRTVAAYTRAAEAHDNAASMYEKLARRSGPEGARHLRRAGEHRDAAAAARRAVDEGLDGHLRDQRRSR